MWGVCGGEGVGDGGGEGEAVEMTGGDVYALEEGEGEEGEEEIVGGDDLRVVRIILSLVR